ncbi:MAG: hypothetical protein ACKVS9_16890 [Phycisphaerae bacterium]
MKPVDIRQLEKTAVEYLAAQLGPRAPKYLSLERQFDDSPLDGEGTTLIFSFDIEPANAIAPCGPADKRHFVAVGETQTNYFPSYGLSPEDAYHFHLGTRFMLEMEIQKVGDDLEPPDARGQLRHFVDNYARGVAIEDERLAALFKCDEGYFAVYRLKLGDDQVYCMGGDCPPGFYKLTQYPPQTALRLHLGKLIRNEAKREQA